MPDYRELYLFLFNRITDALGLLELQEPHAATALLKQAQQVAEESYISK